jgi:hypothetical protein
MEDEELRFGFIMERSCFCHFILTISYHLSLIYENCLVHLSGFDDCPAVLEHVIDPYLDWFTGRIEKDPITPCCNCNATLGVIAYRRLICDHLNDTGEVYGICYDMF